MNTMIFILPLKIRISSNYVGLAFGAMPYHLAAVFHLEEKLAFLHLGAMKASLHGLLVFLVGVHPLVHVPCQMFMRFPGIKAFA